LGRSVHPLRARAVRQLVDLKTHAHHTPLVRSPNPGRCANRYSLVDRVVVPNGALNDEFWARQQSYL
jgi:hypothetical protein